MTSPELAGFTYEDAERAQLRAWVRLSASDKIAFFEEMVELAWHSGALTPQRLALRDAPLGSGRADDSHARRVR